MGVARGVVGVDVGRAGLEEVSRASDARAGHGVEDPRRVHVGREEHGEVARLARLDAVKGTADVKRDAALGGDALGEGCGVDGGGGGGVVARAIAVILGRRRGGGIRDGVPSGGNSATAR